VQEGSKPIGVRGSAFDEVRHRLVEIASRDFPNYSEPLISTRQVARDPGRSGFGVRNFSLQEISTDELAIPRSLIAREKEVMWQRGTTRPSGGQVSSEFGFRVLWCKEIATSQVPISR
jgi:hypothetical protein